MTTTARLVGLQLRAGSRGVLQRVVRGVSTADFAKDLETEAGQPVDVVRTLEDEAEAATVLIDLRGALPMTFDGWDPRREDLFPKERSVVVLLDVSGAQALWRAAPQTASWLGGVRLPAEPPVRPAATGQERAEGEAALLRALDAQPDFLEAHRGQTVGVDLFSGRLFAGRTDATPLDLAQEALDQGILFLTRLR